MQPMKYICNAFCQVENTIPNTNLFIFVPILLDISGFMMYELLTFMTLSCPKWTILSGVKKTIIFQRILHEYFQLTINLSNLLNPNITIAQKMKTMSSITRLMQVLQLVIICNNMIIPREAGCWLVRVDSYFYRMTNPPFTHPDNSYKRIV